jgi:polyhydroxybutyrate depolymerase
MRLFHFAAVRFVTTVASVMAPAIALLAACGSSGVSSSSTAPDGGPSDPSQDGGNGTTGDASDPTELGGDRPVTLHVPPGYVAGVPAPLVVLLHGYSASGTLQDLYFGLTAQSDARGFLYAHPDGLVDADGKRYWNATDACCDLGGTNVDDSKYISSLITQIKERYTVDPKRVFLIGHSNGGFMSYRMACDHSDQIAAVASLAGATFSDVAKCAAASPVSILQIHGTADATVSYDGGQIGTHAYPGAKATVTSWATIDGCGATADTSAPPLDLDTKLAGSETTVMKYASGCKPGGHAELWTIQGGSHIPSLTSAFTPAVLDFLYAHPKP